MTTTATVVGITPLGDEIKSFRLSAPGAFKNATPGAHVDIHLGNGLVRSYSLCDFDPDGNWGVIGVKDEPNGGGGSHWLHTQLRVGQPLEIGEVRNNFALDETAAGYLLIAGGIGVTPMVPMARRVAALGKPMRFVYLARSLASAGFMPVLETLDLGPALTPHIKDRDGRFDLKASLDALPVDHQLYFCGPERLLDDVLAATKDWDPARVHFERFSAGEAAQALQAAPSAGFDVELARTGATFHVPEDTTILQVLLDNGLTPPFGCMDGVCGSCTCGVIEGEVEHRDLNQTAEEHDAEGSMCICVSRAKSQKLVLDL